MQLNIHKILKTVMQGWTVIIRFIKILNKTVCEIVLPKTNKIAVMRYKICASNQWDDKWYSQTSFLGHIYDLFSVKMRKNV